MKTLKQICDAVLERSALGKSNSYIDSNTPAIAYMANESIADLSRYNWPILRKTGTITLTSETLYDLPSDLKFIVPDTMNADGQERHIQLPLNTTDWWYYKTHSPTGIRYKVRIVGDQLEVLSPDIGEVIKFEYVTNATVIASGESEATQSEYMSDGDKCILDDELILKDLKWRYKSEKGIEGWEKDKMLFDAYIRLLKGQAGGSTTLNMGGSRMTGYPEPYTDLYV